MADRISPEMERDILSGAFSKDGIVIKYGVSDAEFDDYCKELVRSGALEIGQFERLTGIAGRPAFLQGLPELSDTKKVPLLCGRYQEGSDYLSFLRHGPKNRPVDEIGFERFSRS